MQIDELKKLMYAEGFIEDYLEHEVQHLAETDNSKHADELKAMWLILTAGLNKLRSENQAMQNKLAGVHNLLDT
jgi:hypothetical protein